MPVEPSPATKPIAPGDLTRLQNERAAAQKWVDACEVDVLEAERVLAMREDERDRAREALRVTQEALQFWKAPAALRRVV